MTLGDLLVRLQRLSGYDILVGSPRETLAAVEGGTHVNPTVGEILQTIMRWCLAEDEKATVERASVVSALGPLRLRLMLDECPGEGFKLLNDLIEAIDAAFDEERLDCAIPQYLH